MTARNGKDGRLSAEGVGRLRRKVREELEEAQGTEGGGAGYQITQAHYLAGSVFLSSITMVMFVLSTIGMSGQLSWQAYLVWGGVSYGLGFAIGFLVARREGGKAGKGRCPIWVSSAGWQSC